MKKSFQEQFKNLKEIIAANVQSLKGLIQQSENLSEIIEKLDETEPKSKELKEQLEQIKSQLSKSIDELVTHTRQLFEAYDKLIDEAFKK
ncbi:MAG: hypothetical protein PQ612_02190 [Rickettsiales bacterium]|nr:hypothetical protein [Pseudomonadota bacterium]MDA0967064.1 hypothetical protein [Pseudomonadota bacterium]MDG4542450.1 hypothetical protein [Rickettsiales bacterium]MDG4544954.1 hypothetical protein [Rickettsiales bacterium]MDG4547077.1 hypothetical protein [Rickettsiales bacterium]